VLESSTEPCSQCGGSGHVRSVSSVALQLLRGIEEILMKGATHNLVVRTRTDVALYVLNHKRGHLRDLENAFKVTLAVVADATVSGQQSFIIDRGEQVHTLEAAKALLAAQAAASPPQVDEPDDDEESFDIEAEIETEETEGLSDDAAASGEEGEGEGDGHRRKRRRRRRGRGEPREGGAPREDNEALRVVAEAMESPVADDGEAEEEEADEVPGQPRADQGQNGERRPRRRGRRGGRRRRGGGPEGAGAEDGLVGSIADELAPASAPEAANAVADFDGGSPEPAPTLVQPEPASQPAQYWPADHAQPEPVASAPAPAPEETAQEADRAAARRRSTVREKVSFMTGAQADPAPSVSQSAPEQPAPPAPEPAPAAGTEDAPRKAGWWSRRFGNGE
jgi:ribonuclease E